MNADGYLTILNTDVSGMAVSRHDTDLFFSFVKRGWVPFPAGARHD